MSSSSFAGSGPYGSVGAICRCRAARCIQGEGPCSRREPRRRLSTRRIAVRSGVGSRTCSE
eukprot:scaffold242035_cov30-Tisochrysis_lutea.AAC.3